MDVVRATYGVRLLREAANLIDKGGLHKGSYFAGIDTGDWNEDLQVAMGLDTPPKCCVLGALAYVAGSHVMEGMEEHEVIRALVDAARVRELADIPSWNDKHTQRKDRVVTTMRKAANNLEQKEFSK